MRKIFDKEALLRFWINLKNLFVPKPLNEAKEGQYLKYVGEYTTEWANFPAYLTYKGKVANEAALPKTASQGDVYTLEDTGQEYFYNGTGWEYLGEKMEGCVKKTGDEMTGALVSKFINDKGIENQVKIQGNSIDVYHDGNEASAAKIKRDQFTLADSDGNIIFKVKMTGGKDIQIGKGSHNNQIVVGNKLTVNNIEAGTFAFGNTNEIEEGGTRSGIFGYLNTVGAKNSLCGGSGNILYNTTSENGSELVIGLQNNVDSSCGAVFGANNFVKKLEASLRTYNENEYGLLSDGLTICDAQRSLVSGVSNWVHGNNAFASGAINLVIGRNSHAEGYNNKVYGASAHVEGDSNIAVNNNTHAEGDTTQAIGEGSHSEGRDTIASGEFSHAQGDGSKATGDGSFASGFESEAKGKYSNALGKGVIAPDREGAFACGEYNVANNYQLFSVGNGANDSNRHNAFEISDTQIIFNENTLFNNPITTKGFLTLNANPTANLHAVPKQYVDAQITDLGKTTDKNFGALTEAMGELRTTVTNLSEKELTRKNIFIDNTYTGSWQFIIDSNITWIDIAEKATPIVPSEIVIDLTQISTTYPVNSYKIFITHLTTAQSKIIFKPYTAVDISGSENSPCISETYRSVKIDIDVLDAANKQFVYTYTATNHYPTKS